jgi:predicted nucleotidyltransferase
MRTSVNMILRLVFLMSFGIVIISSQSLAQTTRDPDQFEKASANVNTTKKKKKDSKNSYKYKINNAVKEYEELMKTNVKKRAKMEKDMEKPQYSDPSYFGHKKKPKKRPLGKRKMCKECGIVH